MLKTEGTEALMIAIPAFVQHDPTSIAAFVKDGSSVKSERSAKVQQKIAIQYC